MKRCAAILFLLATILGSQRLYAAPGVHFGIKLGANATKISGVQLNQEFKLNYQAGVFAEIGLSHRISIQPELIWAQSTFRTANRFSDVYQDFPNSDNLKIKLDYLSIPVLVDIKLSKAFWLQVGPQYSILMNDDKSLVDNGKQAFKTGDFAFVGGVWLQLPVGLSFNARYVIGLTDLSYLSQQNQWKSQAIQLGIGFRLF